LHGAKCLCCLTQVTYGADFEQNRHQTSLQLFFKQYCYYTFFTPVLGLRLFPFPKQVIFQTSTAGLVLPFCCSVQQLFSEIPPATHNGLANPGSPTQICHTELGAEPHLIESNGLIKDILLSKELKLQALSIMPLMIASLADAQTDA